LRIEHTTGKWFFGVQDFLLGELRLGTTGGPAPAIGLRLVTAKHLLDQVKRLALLHLFVRINTKSGDALWVLSQVSDRKYHPSDSTADVALLAFG
jgi:hypothetical protein